MGKAWINGKTIIISGASSGIGRELARMFITKNDCKVIGIGRSEEKMIEFKTSLGDNKDKFEYHLFDVSKEENWKLFAEKIKNRNIDILLNNAGILPPFAKFDSDSIHTPADIINTNFMSVVNSIKYLLPIIEKSSSPAIVNVASSAGLCPLPGIAMYSASKGAVKNFTECLMLEKKYYVGLVCPGFTKTDIFRYQTRDTSNRLIDMISTSLNKMTKKIYMGIRKKKRRMVFGFDAKCMDKMYRCFPKSSPRFFKKVLKSAKVDLFKDVF